MGEPTFHTPEVQAMSNQKPLFVVTTSYHFMDLIQDETVIRSEEVYHKADGKTVKGTLPVDYTADNLFTKDEAYQLIKEMKAQYKTMHLYAV